MSGMYTSYSCKGCKKQLVLLTEEIETMSKDRYLACSYCGSRHIEKQKVSDSVKECMSEHSYKRCNGAIKQRR
jgi:DNA-directed RNA polymerase subunit RPC12/RpoP